MSNCVQEHVAALKERGVDGIWMLGVAHLALDRFSKSGVDLE